MTAIGGSDAPLVSPDGQGERVAVVGGVSLTALTRSECADLMIWQARNRPFGRPAIHTSANGEVIARSRRDADFRALLEGADLVVADGQPLVFASRLLCRRALPERVATTDLFHDLAERAQALGLTFSMLGATQAGIERAVQAAERRYPRLRIIHHRHGYLRGDALLSELDIINSLRPDILWLGMGVPREQYFIRDHASRLSNVGVIKTCGGLFDHLGERVPRAPLWMQRVGLEWFWRMSKEPRRLFWRYMTTNPQALFLMLTRSR